MSFMKIDLKNEKPLYLQLVDVVKQKVFSNDWQQGMKIPSENELAKEFKLSVGTVKKALGVLGQEGILFRRQGQGTFIASPDFSKSFIRFFRYGQTDGEPSEIPGSRILAVDVITAGKEISGLLHLEADDEVIKMKRVRTLHDIPFAAEELYLPYERFKGIEEMYLEDKLLYPIYSNEFRTPVVWVDEFLQPDIAGDETAKLLGIEESTPVICIERIAHSYGDIPIELRRTVGRGDNFRYHIVVR